MPTGNSFVQFMNSSIVWQDKYSAITVGNRPQ